MVMKQVFDVLESHFGSIKSITDNSLRIIQLDKGERLRTRHLNDLVQHRALAVHVRGYYSKQACQEVANTMLEYEECTENWYVSHSKRGQEASDVEAVGMPHNIAVARGKLDSYFRDSIDSTRRWRNNCTERMGPMDKVRLELDEVWMEGCLLARNKSGDPYVAGIPRIMRPPARFDPTKWAQGFAHMDDFELMSAKKGLFSANIYLKNAPSGGELQIWPLTFSTRWDFYRNAPTLSLCYVQDYEAQALLRERFPEPMVINVDEGDLVLLCAQRPHSVKGPIIGGTRVSIQAFLQHEKGKPLRMEC